MLFVLQTHFVRKACVKTNFFLNLCWIRSFVEKIDQIRNERRFHKVYRTPCISSGAIDLFDFFLLHGILNLWNKSDTTVTGYVKIFRVVYEK